MLNELKEKATYYMDVANNNNKWEKLEEQFYVCYEYSELASKVIYDLFGKDIFNEVNTYYKTCNKYGNYGIKVLCELEQYIYFEFVIYNITGMFGDNGEHITDGRFRIMKEIPKNYKDIWELFDKESEEE